MPRYRGGVHQAGRFRTPRRQRAEGRWVHYGPQSLDEHWGIYFPNKLMTEQDGFQVSVRLRDGSRDLPKEY